MNLEPPLSPWRKLDGRGSDCSIAFIPEGEPVGPSRISWEASPIAILPIDVRLYLRTKPIDVPWFGYVLPALAVPQLGPESTYHAEGAVKVSFCGRSGFAPPRVSVDSSRFEGLAGYVDLLRPHADNEFRRRIADRFHEHWRPDDLQKLHAPG